MSEESLGFNKKDLSEEEQKKADERYKKLEVEMGQVPGGLTEAEYREKIFKKANKVKSLGDLVLFIEKVKRQKHDYGSIVVATAAVMSAAQSVVDKGWGITGFQAGCIMHELIPRYLLGIKAPYQILDYNDMLYPQFREKFEKLINEDIWKHLQKKAQKLLDAYRDDSKYPVAESTKAHWQSIVNGNPPWDYKVVDD